MAIYLTGGPMSRSFMLTIAFFCFLSRPSAAQTFTTSSELWCRDTATICWSKYSFGLNGFRIVADLSLGSIVQRGENRLDRGLLEGAPRFGIEVNAFEGWIALQVVFLPPFRTKLDERSPIVLSGRLDNPNREIGIDYGIGLGVSIAEGIISLGGGSLAYDYRSITNPTSEERGSGFFYVNFNPVSAIRAAGVRARN